MSYYHRNRRAYHGRSGGHRRRGNYSNYRPRSKSIDPARFINKSVRPAAEDAYENVHTFSDFDISPGLRANIEAAGFTTPTAIQDQIVPHALSGRDVIGLANTGSGKTAAFIVPIIQRLADERSSRPVALIITPTRELAHQVSDEFRALANGARLFSVVCVGGEPIFRQKQLLARGVDVIIGTPGRLKDLYEQGQLPTGKVNTLVLDEVDRMLDMGFIVDIRFLIDKLPRERQMLCFSATMTRGVESLLAGIQNDAVTISAKTSETSDHIAQDVVRGAMGSQKLSRLAEILSDPAHERVLVFAETKRSVQRLADDLNRQGLSAESIHGNKSQPQRRRALQSFKDNRVKVLCATDVAARGLDIPDVSLVINYEQPQDYDTYIHRIGRTGRAGKSGQALTFV